MTEEYKKNLSTKLVNRLVEEWTTHGNIIIGVDFDDTISPWKLRLEEECKETIELIKDCILVGAYVVIHTACNEDRYEEIRKICDEHGLRINSINKNPIALPYGNNTKPYCNIFIDDRAGIVSACETLLEAMYIVRSWKLSRKLDNPGSTEF